MIVAAAGLRFDRRHRLEQARMIGVRTPEAREARQPGIAGIDEQVQLAPADIDQVGGDVLGGRIVVELMVDDDPGSHTMLSHHLQQKLMPPLEPLYAQFILLSDAEQLRQRRDDAAVEQLDRAVCQPYPVR
jgi:hypothetical protein